MSRQPPKLDKPILSYWPHAGIAIGALLNLVGLATGTSNLIGTGSNVVAICGLFLVQRRRNAKRDDG